MDTTLTKEQIATAVRLRVLERKYWEQIAAELGVARSTLWLARRTETWADVALEVVNEIKAEAFPVAWQGLLDAAALKDVAACREILNRVDEVVEQKLRIYDGDAKDKLNAKIAALAARTEEDGSDSEPD